MAQAQLKSVSTEAPAEADSPVGTTMAFTLGQGQQMEFQVVNPGNSTLAQLNAQLDKLRAAGMRQKYIAQRDEAVHNLTLQDRERETTIHRMAVAEQDFKEIARKRKQRIEQANARIGEIHLADEAAFTTNEKRRGDYQMSRNATQLVQALQREIQHDIDQEAKDADEREQALKGHADALRAIELQSNWFQSEIDRLSALINKTE
jgi:hypothetical protein